MAEKVIVSRRGAGALDAATGTRRSGCGAPCRRRRRCRSTPAPAAAPCPATGGPARRGAGWWKSSSDFLFHSSTRPAASSRKMASPAWLMMLRYFCSERRRRSWPRSRRRRRNQASQPTTRNRNWNTPRPKTSRSARPSRHSALPQPAQRAGGRVVVAQRRQGDDDEQPPTPRSAPTAAGAAAARAPAICVQPCHVSGRPFRHHAEFGVHAHDRSRRIEVAVREEAHADGALARARVALDGHRRTVAPPRRARSARAPRDRRPSRRASSRRARLPASRRRPARAARSRAPTVRACGTAAPAARAPAPGGKPSSALAWPAQVSRSCSRSQDLLLERQQAQRVRDAAAALAEHRGHLLLRGAVGVEQPAVGRGLLDRAEVLALDVLQQRDLQRLGLLVGARRWPAPRSAPPGAPRAPAARPPRRSTPAAPTLPSSPGCRTAVLRRRCRRRTSTGCRMPTCRMESASSFKLVVVEYLRGWLGLTPMAASGRSAATARVAGRGGTRSGRPPG